MSPRSIFPHVPVSNVILASVWLNFPNKICNEIAVRKTNNNKIWIIMFVIFSHQLKRSIFLFTVAGCEYAYLFSNEGSYTKNSYCCLFICFRWRFYINRTVFIYIHWRRMNVCSNSMEFTWSPRHVPMSQTKFPAKWRCGKVGNGFWENWNCFSPPA